MPGGKGPPDRDPLLDEAADWHARMSGPDASVERARFEGWLAADLRHRAAYEQIERLWRLTGRVAETPTGRARGLSKPLTPSGIRRRSYLVAAALGVLLLGLAVMLSARHLAPSQSPGFASAVGEIRSIRLADGTVVTLDTASRLAVAFAGGERRLSLLEGRARFDVAHDPRSFVVEAGGSEIVAHGTLFDVHLDGRRVIVTPLRGSVDIQGREGRGEPDRSSGAVSLAPGQRLSVRPDQAPAIEAAPPQAARWTSGMLYFDGTPLADVIAATNRYSRRTIRFGDPAVARLRVTGVFDPRDAQSLAAKLAAAFDLQVHTDAEGNPVLTRRSD